jgi:ABC-type phosphate transport system substrate-binding protein
MLRLCVAVLSVALVGAAPAEDEEQAYRLVVHSTNPVSQIKSETVARLFLKKTRLWQDGRPAQPVDQSSTSSVRRAFSKQVLHLSIGEVRDYWMKQTLSSAEIPPPVRSGDSEILEFVRAEPGAVAYVSVSIDLPNDVKVVQVSR